MARVQFCSDITANVCITAKVWTWITIEKSPGRRIPLPNSDRPIMVMLTNTDVTWYERHFVAGSYVSLQKLLYMLTHWGQDKITDIVYILFEMPSKNKKNTAFCLNFKFQWEVFLHFSGSNWQSINMDSDNSLVQNKLRAIARTNYTSPLAHWRITGPQWVKLRFHTNTSYPKLSAVTPVRQQWSYCSLVLSHWYDIHFVPNTYTGQPVY